MAIAKTKEEAKKKAMALLKRIEMPGFQIDVWYNMHWCWALRSAWLTLHAYEEDQEKTRYVAFLNDRGDFSSGDCVGVFGKRGPEVYYDPNAAIKARIKDAYLHIGEVYQKLMNATEALELEVNQYVYLEIPVQKQSQFVTGKIS